MNTSVQRPKSQTTGEPRRHAGGPPRRFRQRVGIEILILLLMSLIVIATGIGTVRVAPRAIIGMLLNKAELAHVQTRWSPSDEVIIFQIRLPRIVAAAFVGAALSVAGSLFQGLLRNPMADPYVIGTSGGAGLGAILGLVLSNHFSFLGFGAIPASAFLGALGTMVLVYYLARIGGRTQVVTLLLVGFAISVIFGYAMSLLLILNDRLELNTRIIYSWLLGGISVTQWSQVFVIGLVVIIGTVAAVVLGKSLNALSLGDESAAQIGIDVEHHKAAIIAIGSLLTAAAISGGGLIGFVGLVVPHVVRLLFGPDYRSLLPLVALSGAVFLIFADLLARTVMAPAELPVGILTAFIGGPFSLWMLRRTKREYRF